MKQSWLNSLAKLTEVEATKQVEAAGLGAVAIQYGHAVILLPFPGKVILWMASDGTVHNADAGEFSEVEVDEEGPLFTID